MHYYNTYVIKNRISICADLRTAQCTGGTYTAISKIIPVWRVAQLHRAEEKELIKQLHEKQRRIISGFSGENVPTTAEPTLFGETLE